MKIRNLAVTAALALLGAVVPASAQYRVAAVSAMGGRCIDLPNGRTAIGTEMITWACNGDARVQQFDVKSGKIMLTADASRCLVATDLQPGRRITVGACDHPNSGWRFENNQIKSRSDASKCMGALWAGETVQQKYTASNIIVVNCANDPAMKFWLGMVGNEAQMPKGAPVIESGARGAVGGPNGKVVRGEWGRMIMILPVTTIP